MKLLKYFSIINCLLCLLVKIKKVTSITKPDIQYEMCRVTKTGSEFMGKIYETRSGQVCEYWESGFIGDQTNITDRNFPDGNKRAARNFCRNPDNSPDGPWCFIKSGLGKKENCTVPICSGIEEDCKSTGPGMEYVGGIQKSVFDNECLHWAAVAKNDSTAQMLPEGNLMLAGKSCRNPTGVVTGPWCYVLGETISAENELNEESWIKEPCDVPTCFNLQQITVVTNETEHPFSEYSTHFSTFKGESEELMFSTRLWNPEDWRYGELRLVLSLLAIPIRGDQLRKWDIGYEITISNNKAGATPSEQEDEDWEDKLRIMSGVQWSHFKLSWSNNFISLSAQDEEKPYFIHEIKPQDAGIISQQHLPMKYISIKGTFVYWNFSQTGDHCPEHITNSMAVTRYWQMLIESVNKYLEFHLRSDRECVLNFKISPVNKYPKVQLRINGQSEKAAIYLIQKGDKESVLASTLLPTALSYWKWSEFSISITGRRFYMLVTTKKGVETVFDVNDNVFQGITWFAISSAGMCHWSLFCKPSQMEYEAVPPECSVSQRDMEYQGHQWITQSGLPCLPWNIQTDLHDNQFSDGSITAAVNYCRNPGNDQQGTYCIAIDMTTKDIITKKQYCKLRKCKFADCRIAGTGNDFMGQISTTITGRTCQSWSKNKPHTIPMEFLRDERFPERSVKDASNYCRDPSLSVGGPYCYTQDTDVPIDLCDIPDCYKPTACTIKVIKRTSKKVYLVPEWRAYGLPLWIKMWNPNVTAALVLNIYPLDKEYMYQLILGDDDNEHIKLNYIPENGEIRLLKQKTHSHFLSSGRWVGIIIKIQDDEIKIYYENTPNPLFIWTKGKRENLPPINAVYFSYESRSKHDEGSLGLNFPCDVCHTEICIKERALYSVFYPMNLWKENSSIKVDNITFYLRGNGSFYINLYVIPSNYPTGVLNLEDRRFEIQYTRKKYIDSIKREYRDSPAILKDYWTEIILTVDDNEEKEGKVFVNGTAFMTWTYPKTPVIYYFGIKCADKVTWTVNCKPPILDDIPVDGGWSEWSPWECSVSCGGGQGIRRRTCDNPEPTMLGKVCAGEPIEKGSCSEIACGDITLKTINAIRKYLAQQANNININVGDSVELKCNQELLKDIFRESPKSTLYWNKNGIKIATDEIIENRDINDFKLDINDAKTSKSGVYACILVKLDEEREIIDVVALIVKSKDYTITKRVGQKLKLQANTLVLNDVYSNLRLTWFLNGHIYKEYEETDLRLIEEETIYPVKRAHEGIWESVVYQDYLALNWTTSWYKLKVKKRANWATYLLEEDLFGGLLGDNEIVIYIILILLFSLAIGAAASFTIFVIKLQRDYKNLRQKTADSN